MTDHTSIENLTSQIHDVIMQAAFLSVVLV